MVVGEGDDVVDDVVDVVVWVVDVVVDVTGFPGWVLAYHHQAPATTAITITITEMTAAVEIANL